MSTIETLRANLVAAQQREAEAKRVLAALTKDDAGYHEAVLASIGAFVGVGHHEHKLWLYTNHPETWAAMQPQ